MKRDEYPLKSMKTIDVLAVVQVILNQRVAHKIIIEAGRPIIAYRPRDDSSLEEEGITLDGALRQADLMDYSNSEGNPFEVIFDMMQLVALEGMYPTCWATGHDQEGILGNWLTMEERGMPSLGDTLLNVPIFRLRPLPESSLILCASKSSDADEKDIVFAIRTTMELHKEARNEERADADSSTSDPIVSDLIGSDSEECTSPAREPETSIDGDDVGRWFPTNLLGVQLGNSLEVCRKTKKSD